MVTKLIKSYIKDEIFFFKAENFIGYKNCIPVSGEFICSEEKSLEKLLNEYDFIVWIMDQSTIDEFSKLTNNNGFYTIIYDDSFNIIINWQTNHIILTKNKKITEFYYDLIKDIMEKVK